MLICHTLKQFSDFASLNIVSDIKLDGVALLIALFINKCLSCLTKLYIILNSKYFFNFIALIHRIS
jgi:hypothetical protein